jgi:hypothetical protein
MSPGDDGMRQRLPRDRIRSGGPLVVSLRRKLTSSMVTAIVDCESDSDRLALFFSQRQLTHSGAEQRLMHRGGGSTGT